jgi:hypothetical protein
VCAFKRKGRRVFTVKIADREGRWRPRTLKTRDAGIARKMQAMLTALGPEGKRAYDVTDRVLSGALSVAELWDLWIASEKDLRALRRRLRDVDLEPFVEEWYGVLTGPRSAIAPSSRPLPLGRTLSHPSRQTVRPVRTHASAARALGGRDGRRR